MESRGQNNRVNSVSFSPDGKTLASGSLDGSIKLWDMDLDSSVARNCDWIRHYLAYNPNVEERHKQMCDRIGSKKIG